LLNNIDLPGTNTLKQRKQQLPKIKPPGSGLDKQPHIGDPLLPGATPAAIRNTLLPEDQAQFDTAYQRALVTAREDMGLTGLFRCLEHWRRMAQLQRDPARFASIVRRAAERLTGEPVLADEPLALTRRQVGL
jgi:Family of unknown function (DUF6247)